MPPRHTFWTILFGGKPTAFRAATQEELLPTFKQILGKHPDAVMMWSARGKLGRSEEEARAPAFARKPSGPGYGGPGDRPRGPKPEWPNRGPKPGWPGPPPAPPPGPPKPHSREDGKSRSDEAGKPRGGESGRDKPRGDRPRGPKPEGKDKPRFDGPPGQKHDRQNRDPTPPAFAPKPSGPGVGEAAPKPGGRGACRQGQNPRAPPPRGGETPRGPP